ncbi:hypothetical protein [Rhodoferax sp. UBA5149]|uniref:hypothetical protein n=1 Tax=Rhodoferax sp. UBA5149 TaxID=1947379 RepID=UPI0025E230EA|nr:hypothetical protein [Rhodoferax sp. UBA5149]
MTQLKQSTAGGSIAERLVNARKAMDAKEWWTAAFELDKAVREDPRNADLARAIEAYKAANK